MISKMNKVQNSWFMKAVLTLTALSFMSLFGIAGWLSAPKNKPVIKVDDIVVYQDEVAIQFDQEQRIAKNVFGDNFELNESIKEAMLQGIVQRELENAILQRTAQKYNIYISDNLIRQIIFSQAEFMDDNGRFNVEKLRRLLAMSGWTEARYINTIRKDVIKQNLINGPVENVNVPKVLADNLAKLENQQKVFQYIKIDPAAIKVDRKITQDELEQYYQDFNVNFMEPEKRDVSFVVIEHSDIEKSINPTQDEIDAYYEANISQFEVPETRNVLQILVQNESDANEIAKDLAAKKDFYQVASKYEQSKDEVTLGEISKDMLVPEIADDVFDASREAIVGPVNSELGWHILKVTKITPAKKASKAEANAKIIATLRSEKAYDEAYDISKGIDDKIGGGAKLSDIAADMKIKVHTVKGLTENATAQSLPSTYRDLVKSGDFLDNAFSYDKGEVSQVIELDNGFLLLEVTDVVETHARDINSVKSEIEKMWLENEKNSIAQEITNDVMADLEYGDALDEIAKRFSLSLRTTKALKRSENFEKLSTNEMLDLFHEDLGKPKVISMDKTTIIAVPLRVEKSGKALSAAEIQGVASSVKADLTNTYRATLINDFANDYDVRVKYRQIGLSSGL